MKRVVLVLAACSGHGTTIDAPGGGGSSLGPAPCPVAPGLTYTLSAVGFEGPGKGFDLDGDGKIDNALGYLAPVANQVLSADVASGFSRYLFVVERWDNAPADDPDVAMVSYSGVDADQPPDTSNDFTGSGEFYVTSRDFDVDCNPQNTSRSGSIAGLVLSSRADRWNLFVRNIGSVVFAKVILQWTMSPDRSTAVGELGAVMTDCALSRAYLPQLGSGTFLDLILQQGNQADIDVDGDGLETIDYAGGQIVGCTDGDGTKIPGPQCMCDPRIADGYSIAVFANGVTCKIDGVIETE
jgi:hypothetical protein